jgi:hypothetical protein
MAATRDGAAMVAWLSDAAGRWTLEVDGTTVDAEVAYTLRVTPPDEVCAADALEPNDGAADAAAIGPGVAYELGLCPGDEDWFAVVLGRHRVLRATLLPEPGSPAPALTLYDDAGTPLATGVVADGDVVLDHDALAPGTYRLRVWAAAGPTPYTLFVADEPWPCVDDRREPDDTIAAATLLTAPASVEGLVCGGDADWFALDLGAGDRVLADLWFRHDIGDLNLYLTRGNGQTLALSGSRDDDEHIDWTAPAAGRYGLRVFGILGSSAPYRLDVRVEAAAPPCADDALEDDDGPAQATPVTAALAWEELALCPGDDDWFALPLAAGDTLVVDVTTGSAGAAHPPTVAVHGPDGAVLATSGPTGVGARVIAAAAADGEHTIVVGGAPPGGLAYRIRPTVYAGGVVGGCVDDPYEDDDEPAAATPVSLAAGRAAVLAQRCDGDVDWFAVPLPGGRSLSLTLEHEAPGPLWLAVQDPAGLVLADVAVPTGARDALTVDALLVGDYLVRVSGPDGVEGPYRLTIAASDWVCVEDEFEENDTLATAWDVTGRTTLAGAVCRGDPDWFALDLVAGDTLRVDLRFVHAAGDLNLYVTRANGQTVAFGGSSDDDEHVTYTADTTGRHGIRVFGLLGASNRYTLDLALTPGP